MCNEISLKIIERFFNDILYYYYFLISLKQCEIVVLIFRKIAHFEFYNGNKCNLLNLELLQRNTTSKVRDM